MSFLSKIGLSLIRGIRIPLVAVILFVIMIVLLGLIAYTKPQIFGLSVKNTDKQDTQSLILEVSKVIKLPEGETPTVGEVTDLSKVTNQKFFENAVQGDKFLVYKDAKKAFLYRPSEKRIIEVGVVNLSENPTPAPSPIPTQMPIVDVSNEGEITPTATPIATSSPKLLITPSE